MARPVSQADPGAGAGGWSDSPTGPAHTASGQREGSGCDRSLYQRIYRDMVRARTMEERMIKMSKSGEGHFWIGGPGEEAFNVPLGLQVRRGRGPAFDYLHLHYRASAVLLAMGMPMLDAVRQMAMKRTDPHSRGRNFVGHFSCPAWNVVPVTSVIEIQYAIAPGTARMQRRHGGQGVTIVTGGEAGTAEGDFASCLIWSSRPGEELPLLIIVMNNGYGISTPLASQHAVERIIDRGRPFGIAGEVVDGNDPLASWAAIERALSYCRRNRRPFLLEARVSRLYGHSSSSGAQRVEGEVDCLEQFARTLIEREWATAEQLGELRTEAQAEMEAAVRQAMSEPDPEVGEVYRGCYAPSSVDAVYPEDYRGLPGSEFSDDR